MNVHEALQNWQRARPLRDPGRARAHIERLTSRLGCRDVDSLRGSELSEYREALRAEGLSDSTINRELTYLRAALRLALQEERVSRIPHVPMAREAEPRQRYVTEEQLEDILEHLERDQADLVEFLFRTGWRRGQALKLTWDDVDFDKLWIVCPGSKTKSGAASVYPLTGRVGEIVKRRHASRDGCCDRVFSRWGRPISTIRKAWKTATELAGHAGLRLHDLRRSLAHHHLKKGVPQRVTMELAGWKTDAMWRRYAIVDQDLMVAAIEAAEGD